MSFLWPAWNCAIHVGEREDDSEQQRHQRNRQNQRRRDLEMVAPEPGAIHLRRVMNILGDRRKPREDNDCRQHDLSALIVLFSFAEATLPAWTLSVPAVTLDVRSTDASGAFVLIRKGKGHGDRDERFERHHRNQPTRLPATARIRMACAPSTAIKGSVITQASEAATETSPMAKSNPMRT